MNRSKAAVIASAAATLIIAGAVSVRSDEQTQKSPDQVMCAGINDCAGKSVCRTADTTCAGLNSCKGKGVVSATQKDCVCHGGKVVDAQKDVPH